MDSISNRHQIVMCEDEVALCTQNIDTIQISIVNRIEEKRSLLKSVGVNLLPLAWRLPTSYVQMRLHGGFLQIIVDGLDRRPLLGNCESKFAPLELEDSIEGATSYPTCDTSSALT